MRNALQGDGRYWKFPWGLRADELLTRRMLTQRATEAQRLDRMGNLLFPHLRELEWYLEPGRDEPERPPTAMEMAEFRASMGNLLHRDGPPPGTVAWGLSSDYDPSP